MARIRQAVSDRSQAANTDESDRGDGTRSSRSALLRKVLIVLGLGVVVYLVTRRGTITERGSRSNPTDSKSAVTTGSATAEQAGEELPGTDRVPGEIEQRGTEYAHEEPAEPGEMHVDEEIVDDVLDEEPDEGDNDSE